MAHIFHYLSFSILPLFMEVADLIEEIIQDPITSHINQGDSTSVAPTISDSESSSAKQLQFSKKASDGGELVAEWLLRLK
jgi:hypothetical protein